MKKLMLIVCLALSPIFGAYAAQPEGKYDDEIAADRATDVIETPTSADIHSQTPATPARPSFIGRHPAATVAMTTLFSVAVLSYLMSGAQLGDIVDDADARSEASTLHCALFGCPAEEQRVASAAFAARGILASIPAAAIAGIGTRLYIKIKQAIANRLSKVRQGTLTAEQLRKLELLKGGPSVDDSPEDSAAIIALYGKNFEDQLDKDLAAEASWQAQQSDLISKMQQVQRNLESKSVAPAAVVAGQSSDDEKRQEAVQQALREKRQLMLRRACAEILSEQLSRAIQEAKEEQERRALLSQYEASGLLALPAAVQPVASTSEQASTTPEQPNIIGQMVQEVESQQQQQQQQPESSDAPVVRTISYSESPTQHQTQNQLPIITFEPMTLDHILQPDQQPDSSATPVIVAYPSEETEHSDLEFVEQTLTAPSQDSAIEQHATTVATVPTDAIDSQEERLSTLPLEPMHHDPMKRLSASAAPLSQQPVNVVRDIVSDLWTDGTPENQTPQQQQEVEQKNAPEEKQPGSSFLGEEQLYI
ncbi:MAG: hypothetical protein WCW33_02290 [Candidatus Babeliales bacterium]